MAIFTNHPSKAHPNLSAFIDLAISPK